MGRYKKNALLLMMTFLPVLAGNFKPALAEENAPDAQKRHVLSLDQVTRLALENNFDIQLAKYDTLISRTTGDVAESIYDTVAAVELSYRDNQRDQTTTIVGTKSIENDYNFILSRKLPTGTTLTLDSENKRRWSDSSFASLTPSHDSILGVTIEQDLGKNFFGIQDRGDVKITRIDIANTQFSSLEKIEKDLADVQNAYWDLVLQDQRVKIEKDMVEQAKRLYDLNTEKIKHGLVESPDLLAAEANYQDRLNRMRLIKNQRKTKENVIKLLLNITDEDITILPSDDFVLTDNPQELPQALKSAFAHRQDYKKALKTIESKDIHLAMKKNNIWPEINLKVTLAQNGVEQAFQDSLEKMADGDHPDYLTELTVNMPLENREAKAELREARFQKARALVALKRLERQISIGIVDQVRLCHVLQEVAVHADEVADIQARKLKAEEKRFQSGRSNADTIIRFQEDVLKARIAAAEEKFRYHLALIELLRLEGTLLNQYWDGAI